ncbi:MAG: creatininase family protein, partial [Candidatus Binatia bacterium]
SLERSAEPAAASLERLAWPEVESAIAAGKTTLVVPLGATEQHGPHLPLDTDARIARELAARFCRHVPEAIAAPVVALGCSREHSAFPGTLSLETETLERLLRDLLAPLRGHGFRRAFVFSAHGGNVQALREMAPRLRSAVAPLEVTVFADLGELMPRLQAASARFGVSAEASGHHAGEFETSILLALEPDAVREARLAAGFTEPTDDPQSLFYPSLREHAPNGVVGDPRGADAARGETYLEAWVDELVAAYGRGT